MEYNLKITNYVDDVQVSYYSKPIERKEDYETDNKLIKRNNKRDIQDNCNSISPTWYNPTTCTYEVIPEGFQVIDEPFGNGKMLFPRDEYLDENIFISMEFEEMFPYVQRKIAEEKEKKDFLNNMRSIRRTKQTIYKIARANEWELFVTFTFQNEEFRNDYDSAKNYFTKRIDNVKQKNSLCFKYLLIPEQDKNGNWHFHGLFKDIKGIKLTRAMNPHTGKPIVQNGIQVYNLPQFNVVGHNTATYVQNNSKVTRYILKYITKEMEIKFPNKRKYLCSKGLSRGEDVLFKVDSLEDIPECLKDVYAYDLIQTHESRSFNVYSGSDIVYKQYRK